MRSSALWKYQHELARLQPSQRFFQACQASSFAVNGNGIEKRNELSKPGLETACRGPGNSFAAGRSDPRAAGRTYFDDWRHEPTARAGQCSRPSTRRSHSHTPMVRQATRRRAGSRGAAPTWQEEGFNVRGSDLSTGKGTQRISDHRTQAMCYFVLSTRYLEFSTGCCTD